MAHQPKTSGIQGLHILVIEDGSVNRILYSAILEATGAQMEYNVSGRNVIDQLHDLNGVDLILLDMMFPRGINGLDIYRDIRAVDEFDNIPVIAVTAKNTEQLLPVLKKEGFKGLIAKPINIASFSRQILS